MPEDFLKEHRVTAGFARQQSEIEARACAGDDALGKRAALIFVQGTEPRALDRQLSKGGVERRVLATHGCEHEDMRRPNAAKQLAEQFSKVTGKKAQIVNVPYEDFAKSGAPGTAYHFTLARALTGPS